MANVNGGLVANKKAETKELTPQKQMAGMCSADPFQHHYCSMGTALCIWFHRSESICHADCRDRRDPGYRCTWKYPVSDAGTSL